MIEDIGDIQLSECDDANIPVNIFISKPNEDDEGKHKDKWTLHADNFMPRKMSACDGYEVVADSLEELQAYIKQHVLPLYEIAMKNIDAMINATGHEEELPHLYYWH